MSSSHVSRRSVARGAAWAAPAVAIGVAAPSYAASAAAPTAVIDSLCACGSGGRKYRISVTFTNPVGSAFNLSNMSVAIGNQTGLAVTPSTAVVGAGPGTTTLQFGFTRGNLGGFTSVSFTYTATNASNSQSAGPKTITLTTATAPTCTNPTC